MSPGNRTVNLVSPTSPDLGDPLVELRRRAARPARSSGCGSLRRGSAPRRRRCGRPPTGSGRRCRRCRKPPRRPLAGTSPAASSPSWSDPSPAAPPPRARRPRRVVVRGDPAGPTASPTSTAPQSASAAGWSTTSNPSTTPGPVVAGPNRRNQSAASAAAGTRVLPSPARRAASVRGGVRVGPVDPAARRVRSTARRSRGCSAPGCAHPGFRRTSCRGSAEGGAGPPATGGPPSRAVLGPCLRGRPGPCPRRRPAMPGDRPRRFAASIYCIRRRSGSTGPLSPPRASGAHLRGCHPEGAAHCVVSDQLAVDVECPLHRRDRGVDHPDDRREVDRNRVSGVQCDQRVGDPRHVVDAAMEAEGVVWRAASAALRRRCAASGACQLVRHQGGRRGRSERRRGQHRGVALAPERVERLEVEPPPRSASSACRRSTSSAVGAAGWLGDPAVAATPTSLGRRSHHVLGVSISRKSSSWMSQMATRPPVSGSGTRSPGRR